MLQALRQTPRKIAAVIPGKRLFSGLRYRLYRMSAGKPKVPEALRSKAGPGLDHDTRNMSFTFALVGLSAQIATCGGKLTRAKYLAFRDAFPLQDSICGTLRSLFAMACASPLSWEHYAAQVNEAFPEDRALAVALLARLMRIASADGAIAPATETMLAGIAHRLGISAAEFIRLRHLPERELPPHDVLGITKDSSPGGARLRYRELMKRYHPDRYASTPLSPEAAILLHRRSADINRAYEELKRHAS